MFIEQYAEYSTHSLKASHAETSLKKVKKDASCDASEGDILAPKTQKSDIALHEIILLLFLAYCPVVDWRRRVLIG